MAQSPFVPIPLLLCLLAIAGCRATDKKRRAAQPDATPPSTTRAPAPMLPQASDQLDVPLTLRPLAGAAVHASRDRAALLITADKYRAPLIGDLPQVAPGVGTLRAALVGACSIPPSAIVEKSGAAAIEQEIKGAIAALGESTSGKSALLVVFYTGHGVIDAEGQMQLFAHYTERDGSAFINTLPRREILKWLATARARAKGRGVDLETVLVVDACRTNTMSAPPRAKLVREEAWEIYSTSEGEFADAPADAGSPFVRALSESLGVLANRGEADLRATFAEAKRRLAEGGAAQTPQLVAPSDAPGPTLVLPGRVRVGLRVVDALDDRPLEAVDAVLADGNPLPREGDFFVLQTGAGRNVRLQASKPGYLPFDRSFPVKREDNGAGYALPLAPGYTRLRGRVSPAVAVEVTAECSDERAVARAGYHKTLVYTTLNAANFELRLPPAAAAARTRVVIKQGPREVASVAIDLSKSTADVEDGVRVLDLGTVELRDADVSALPRSTDLGALAAQLAQAFAQDELGGIQLPSQFAQPNLVPPTFTEPFESLTWDAALKAYQDRNLELARTHLRSLQQSRRSTPNETVTNLAGHVELLLARQAKTDDEVEAQITASVEADAVLATALRAVLAARKLGRARTAANAGDLAALPLLCEAATLEPDADTLYSTETRKRIRELRWLIAATLLGKLDPTMCRIAIERLRADDPEAWNDPEWSQLEQPLLVAPLAEWLKEGLARGLASGDWTVADDAINQRCHVFPTDVPQDLAELEAKVARERVPLSVRQSFIEAEKAEAEKRLDDALRSFEAAREGANTHWRGQIDLRQQSLRDQILRQALDEVGTAPTPAKKLDALLRASSARQRLVPGVDELLRANPDLAADPEVRQKLAAIDGMQLAAARAARSRLAWRDYLADHPQGIGAAEGRAMLARMQNPWQQAASESGAADLRRYGHSLAFDESRDVTLMFGGTSDGATGRDDTWNWDGKVWQRLAPPSRPTARAFHAMAYDAARRVTVLFGGTNDNGKTVLDDTWLFDGNTWRAVESGPRPPARCKHALAFDSERNRVVLYGGASQRDTWEWDGERWRNVSPPKVNPGRLTAPGLALCRPERRLVLLGGDGRTGTAWFWDGRAWTSVKTTGVEGSVGGTLVAAGNRLLRFGGLGKTVTDELLTYDAGAWSVTRTGTPPPAREFHAAAFDSKRNMLIVHGGMVPPARRREAARVFGDTWEFVVEP